MLERSCKHATQRFLRKNTVYTAPCVPSGTGVRASPLLHDRNLSTPRKYLVPEKPCSRVLPTRNQLVRHYLGGTPPREKGASLGLNTNINPKSLTEERRYSGVSMAACGVRHTNLMPRGAPRRFLQGAAPLGQLKRITTNVLNPEGTRTRQKTKDKRRRRPRRLF